MLQIKKSNSKFLIYTGSEVNVTPRSTEYPFLNPTGLPLKGANNTKISTYGGKTFIADVQ